MERYQKTHMYMYMYMCLPYRSNPSGELYSSNILNTSDWNATQNLLDTELLTVAKEVSIASWHVPLLHCVMYHIYATQKFVRFGKKLFMRGSTWGMTDYLYCRYIHYMRIIFVRFQFNSQNRNIMLA